MKDINKLAEEFFSNTNVCVEPKTLKLGDQCFVIDISMINPETDFYAVIPVKVVAVQASRFPGRLYYWFEACGSKNDELLNTQHDVFLNQQVTFYKILENTSPYILLSEPDQ